MLEDSFRTPNCIENVNSLIAQLTQNYPFTSASNISDLLERMIGNGLDAFEKELEQISWFLSQTFVP